MRTMTKVFNLVFLLLFVATAFGAPRHIVFIVADDLGWNDVGFHNADMITPNIDKLAYQGVILNSSYVQPVCTPSRHSWMTGVYPFKVGLQRGVILPNVANCSPLNLELVPQKLKKLGYSTNMVGKWHLGSCSWNCTPTYRGFDSFLGYYNGMEDYYTKVILNGIDFHLNEKPLNDTDYSVFIYAEQARKIIQSHDKQKPLFLYLPFQSVHAPVEVPERFENMYPHIQTVQRRQYCGMVSALDEAIGNVTQALREAGMMEDTLIIFTADNGGMPTASGNNYPLRGGKSTVFEGGTRAVAFVVGAGLQKTGYTYDGLMHAVDWHPTIVAAAGGDTSMVEDDIDGINLWEALKTGSKSSRTELVYNLDNAFLAQQGHAAIRVGDFKLIQGFPGPFQDWYPPDTVYKDDYDATDENEYFDKKSREYSPQSNCLQKDVNAASKKACNGLWKGDGLYNLKDDPTEHNDLSDMFPDVVKQLETKLDEYRKSLVEPKPFIPDPKSNPKNYGGYWMPGWC